ncbi:alpha-ketoglutarate-dependent dioxygenase AlkB family protein [Allohahella marinimesophila]|uniref:Alpha-ketoglutarate-dependent dioxygenase AlkB n=1 Tax=Allohahella marinimesophila TaxID=1054972 RepID=A0ABP7PPT6_9GAMM
MAWKSDFLLGNNELQHIALSGGDVQLYTDVLATAAAEAVYSHLRDELHWRQDQIRIHGRVLNIPRLQAWYGEPHCVYTYSGTTLAPRPMPHMLQQLAALSSALSGSDFNCVLCNLYRDGEDSMGWHADNEPELGPEPVIASWSFGAIRRFHLKPLLRAGRSALAPLDPDARVRIDLPHNSLLLMQGATQQNWQHRVSKSRQVDTPRLNLTFRYIAEADAGSA